MHIFRVKQLCTVPVFLALAACAPSGGLDQQVQQHDAQLRQMQPAQADAWNQLQAMRQELNELKGQLDGLNNAGGTQALVEHINRQDAALRQVESNMALDLNLGEPLRAGQATGGAAPVAGGTPGTPSYGDPQSTPQVAPQSATPMTGDYGLPAQGQTQGSVSVGTPGYAAAVPAGTQPYAGNSGSMAAQAPSAATWGQPSPQDAQMQQSQQAGVQAPQKDISLALYDAGVNAYNARKYDEAQRSFSDFLKNYQSHNLVPDAQYYLAECYFQRNQFADAALAYDTIIKKYPKSNRAPGAYLKQGISFSKLNQGAAAKARMQELIKKFPNAPEAARAKSFLKTNK